MVPSSSILDAGSLHILEQLKYGKINIRQAAELLKVEPTILAYELAAKVFLMILTNFDHSISECKSVDHYIRGEILELTFEIL